MSKKHFLLYDFLLPLAGILALGRFFAGRFAPAIFSRLDSIQPFGLGAWFLQSDLRSALWAYAWLLFSVFPALGWLVWVRLNLETDPVDGRLFLDRPIFTCFRLLTARLVAARLGNRAQARVRPGRGGDPEEVDGPIRLPEARLAEAKVPEKSLAPDADFRADGNRAGRRPLSRRS